LEVLKLVVVLDVEVGGRHFGSWFDGHYPDQFWQPPPALQTVPRTTWT
jgi:hypothetical protein